MSNHNQTEQVISQIESLSDDWKEFNRDYKELKNQVSSMNIALNRPYMVNDSYNNNYAEKSALADFLRKGEIKPEHQKNFSSSNDEGGGLISPYLSKEILSQLSLISPLRKLASVMLTSSNKVHLVVEDGQFESGWVGETDERGNLGTPKLKHKQIELHELYAQPTATQRLIDDSSVNIENWIKERLVDQFTRKESNAFINGDGDKKPTGILQADGVQTAVSVEEKKLSVESILDMINNLDEYYHANASFIMNRATLSLIQTLKDSSGRFIWQPSYNDKQPQTLFGIPVYCCSDMPVASDKEDKRKIIALGDFKKAYRIVDRADIKVMRDPYTSKPLVKFYATKRVGGEVVDPKALNLLEM